MDIVCSYICITRFILCFNSVFQCLVDEKDSGSSKVSSTLEAGEKLYPSTSSEGREVIRQELRDLREKWDTYTDHLGSTQRHLEGSLMQWASYDESYNQLVGWVRGAEQEVEGEIESKATLQEKKNQLQHYKVHT